ncbi:hypothetical protein MASR2M15_02420 [Anaerolineales bacterium]
MTGLEEHERIAALEQRLEDEEILIQSLIDEAEELDSLVGDKARLLVKDLRPLAVTDDVYEEMDESASFGDRMADQIALLAGSWAFIMLFVLLMIGWMTFNTYLAAKAFDPYPFILLNLGLSTLAALQAPVILMSQNRQAEKDRAVAQNNFQVNLKSELEIADLHRKMDSLIKLLDNRNSQLLDRDPLNERPQPQSGSAR